MYESLKKVTADFHLYIFGFDDVTCAVIDKMNLEYVTIIPLKDFETPDLLEVKKSRTIAEYCWTCTPSTISYVLEKFKVPNCTYIDSDLCFYSDPSILIRELEQNGKSVLITEHRFSTIPRLYEEKRAGKFCVQFITFLNEEESMKVLESWRTKCIEWCYARYEDGKFGDQKYLDAWPDTYSNIHILEHHGGGIAPWNLTQYKFRKGLESISGKIKKNGALFDVIFYHYQYVRFMEGGLCDIGWYYISAVNRNIFYKPYLHKIIKIENQIRILNSDYRRGLSVFKTGSLKNIIKAALKKIFGYNILNLKTNGISD
jgi:hypothetical protein